MTILADAMKKAGVDTDAALLRSVAVDCLRKADLFPRRALNAFVDEVRDAGGMMASLHPKSDTEELGFAYLQRVAADMRGDALKNPAKAGAGGHSVDASDGHCWVAPGNLFRSSGFGRDGAVYAMPVMATKRLPQQLLRLTPERGGPIIRCQRWPED